MINYTDPEYPAGWAEDYVPVGEDVTKDPQTYALTIEGDSMEPTLQSEDHIVVSPNSPVENGKIAVVVGDDGQKTAKRVYYRDDHILLQPDNRAHNPIILTKKDSPRIIGKVVALIRTNL